MNGKSPKSNENEQIWRQPLVQKCPHETKAALNVHNYYVFKYYTSYFVASMFAAAYLSDRWTRLLHRQNSSLFTGFTQRELKLLAAKGVTSVSHRYIF
jgi:oligoendopeptidase F